MALDKSIRGLTIKLGADTTALGSALKDVNKQTAGITKELRDVDKLLRFNPGNAELLAQKHKLLSDQVGETASKLEVLKKAEKEAQEQFARGEISEKQYRALQREVIETESKLGHYKKQLKDTEKEKSKFRQALDKTTDGLQKFGGKAAEVAKKGAKVFAVGIAGATTAMAAMVTKSAEATDKIDKQSQKLGMSRQAYQEWDYIMSQNGMSIDKLTAGMTKLTKSVDDLSKGGKVATEAFGELGISYEDLEGKTREDIFFDTIMALQDVEDETKRAALANDLLGRSGAELAPLLNAGAGSVEELKQRAHELGIVLDDETIDAGVKFTDTMDDVKRSLQTVGTEIGAALMPIFQEMLEWVIAHMPEIKETMSVVFETIETVVKNVWAWFSENLLPILQDVFVWVSKNWPVFQKIFETVFGVISSVVGAVWKLFSESLWPTLKAVFDWVSDNWPTFQKVFEDTFSAISTVVETLWNWFDEYLWPIFKSVFEWVGTNWPTFQSIFENVFGIITGVVKTLWSWFSDYLLPIFTSVFDYVEENWPTLQSTFETVFGAVSTVVEVLYNWFNDNLLPIFESVFDYVEGHWPTLQSIFETVFGAVSSVVETAWGWLNDFIDIAEDAYDWAKKAIEEIEEFFEWDSKQRATERRTGYTNGSVAGAWAGGGGVSGVVNIDYSLGQSKPLIPDLGANKSGITQNITINSPKALSPSEIANENKKALQRAVMPLMR